MAEIATPTSDLEAFESLVNLWMAGEVNGQTTIDDLPADIDLGAKMSAGVSPKEVAAEALGILYPGVKPSWVID